MLSGPFNQETLKRFIKAYENAERAHQIVKG